MFTYRELIWPFFHQLQVLEKHLSLDDIKFVRFRAQTLLAQDKRLLAEVTQAQQARVTADAPANTSWYRSMFSRITWGASPATPARLNQPPEESAAALSDEQKKVLFATIPEAPVQDAAVEPRQTSVALRLDFQLNEGVILLVLPGATFDRDDQPDRALCQIQFTDFKGRIDRRLYGSAVFECSLGRFCVNDMMSSVNEPIAIVQPKQDYFPGHNQSGMWELAPPEALDEAADTQALNASRSSDTPALPFFKASLELQPYDVVADLKVRFVMQPLEVMYLRATVLALKDFAKFDDDILLPRTRALTDIDIAEKYRAPPKPFNMDVLIDLSAPQVCRFFCCLKKDLFV